MEGGGIAPPRPRGADSGAVRRARDALVFALGGSVPDDDAALAWAGLALPALGFAVGAAASALVRALAGAPGALAAAAGAAVLALGGSARLASTAAGRGAAGGLAAAALFAVEAALLGVLGPAGAVAAPLAAMLGRWAFVVLAYGSQAAPGDALAPRLIRALQFREFASASVTAMALTLLLVDAVGVLLLFAVAGGTIALRIAAHARRGGVSQPALAAAACLAESGVLACCAALAAVLAA